MSVKLMGQVFEATCLRPSARLILLALADHADHDGRHIYPTVALLARKTGVTRRTIQRALRDFETQGLLVRVAEARQHRATEYRADFGRLPRGDILAPLDSPDSRSGATLTPARGVTMTPEPEENRTTREKTSASVMRTSALDGFAAFKAVYPRRRAWGDAERAWRRLKPDPALVARIVEAATRFAASAEVQEDFREHRGRHVPYPASWLNGRQWEDEIEGAPPPYRKIPVVPPPAGVPAFTPQAAPPVPPVLPVLYGRLGG